MFRSLLAGLKRGVLKYWTSSVFVKRQNGEFFFFKETQAEQEAFLDAVIFVDSELNCRCRMVTSIM